VLADAVPRHPPWNGREIAIRVPCSALHPTRNGSFTRFLDDGRLCLTNNAAERALRGIALGRKAWLFAGSKPGGERAAFMYNPSITAKPNDIDPQAWLADVLAPMPNPPMSRLPELLPSNWENTKLQIKAA